MAITYGSVCSGIEAASVAWHPLGWKADWLSEIEPFPSALLAHHYPDVTNLGDMTLIADRIRRGEIRAPDVLVGGTPCQAFSVAGLRKGLDDARGQLTLSFVELANEIDASRSVRGLPASVIVWENVPGVLSSKDNAFGCFLGALVGEDCELVPAGKKWSNSGCVFGPQRTVAWRMLDAQYFGVAQRRRRVFVVASSRADIDPTEILFEFDGLRRDSAPSREKGEEFAHTTASCLTSSGRGVDRVGESSGQDPVVACYGGNNTSGAIDVATARNACASASGRMDFETETFVVHGTQDPCVLDNMAHTLGRNFGQENAVAVTQFGDDLDVSPTLKASDSGTNRTPSIYIGMQVRRLTPVECERLQGFPDNYTNVPYRNKPAADGPRYKALGNSMAVPCMAFIGSRINKALRVIGKSEEAA